MGYTLVPTPHQSGRAGREVKMVVIHGDAGKSDAGTVSWIKNPVSKVSYHYLVGRDGAVYQFVSEDKKAWHAGVSEWDGCTVSSGQQPSVNHTSIGVAFGNDGTGDEAFTVEQYKAGGELVADICKRHAIPIDLIRGHHEVSPTRKTDPWRHFNWKEFFGYVGLGSR